MSNITLSVDDAIIKQARLRSVQEGVSLSAKMRELLQRYVSGQLDTAAPDLSFAENALLFTKNTASAGQPTDPTAADQKPAPLVANSISVDPEYLRKIRGWAREDLYDHPTRYGK